MLRSCLFNLFFWLWTVCCALLGFPLGVSKKHALKLGIFWARVALWLLNILCGITAHKGDLGGVNSLGGSLILSKHQSAWETIFFLAQVKNPVFVLKKELLKIPFYGWYLRNMGMIPLDRKAGISEMKKMNSAVKNAILDGRNVIIFPQGTRTHYLQCSHEVKYRLGVLDIIKDIPHLNMVLVALNSGYFWPKTGRKIPGAISVKTVVLTLSDKKESLSDLKDKIPDIIELNSRDLLNEIRPLPLVV